MAPKPYDKVAVPDRLSWPRGERSAEGATLYLRCAPGHALALQHEGQQIAAAVNRYFGYVLVRRGAARRPSRSSRGAAPKAKDRSAAAGGRRSRPSEAVADVGDDGLREALRRPRPWRFCAQEAALSRVARGRDRTLRFAHLPATVALCNVPATSRRNAVNLTRRDTLILAAAATVAVALPASAPCAGAKDGDVDRRRQADGARRGMPDRSLGNADGRSRSSNMPRRPARTARVLEQRLPAFKDKYVDTGKVKFILRPFVRNMLDAVVFMLAEAAGPDTLPQRDRDLFQDPGPVGRVGEAARRDASDRQAARLHRGKLRRGA